MSEKPVSFLERLLFESSTSPRLVRVLNWTLVALLGTVAFTVLVGLADVHLLVLAGLACGLLASINWFVYELNKVKAAEAAAVAETGEEQRSEGQAAAAAEPKKIR